ncbi:hypothetical protein LZ554_003186 [Drepanopeziza brunnea f. sp. 'monogermtubi']|nr:hypothetical protein LZ554_003186 [Drepanopeziza brunnea f. sp. 'monogermtubi']
MAQPGGAQSMEASDPALGQRILDEIANREYECPICTDLISLPGPVWSCETCYHVYHFHCTETWLNSCNRAWWPCPVCKALRRKDVDMEPRCWCGEFPHNASRFPTNSCETLCLKVQQCTVPGSFCSKICSQMCHPGPCDEVVCMDSCRRRKAALDASVKAVQARVATRVVLRTPSPVHVPQTIHIFDVESSQSLDLGAARPARRRALPPGIRPVSKSSFVALLFVQGMLLLWTFNHVSRAIKPFENPGYTEERRRSEFVLAMVAGTLVSGISGLLFAFRCLDPLSHNICQRLRIWRHTFNPFAIHLLFIFFGACAALAFPVLFCAIPSAAHSHQMKHSCHGFDTRVNLGDLARPPMEFRLPDLTAQNTSASHFRTAPDGLFEIKQASDYLLGPHQGFRKFVRIKGKLHGTDITVDFDLREQRWRMLRGTKNLPPVRTGTWYASNYHVTLPELRLQVPNLFYFTQACYYQPFMTVFRTDNMTDAQVKEQSGKKWTGTSEKNVVMRTTNSGTVFYLDDLKVCARTADYDVDVVAGDGGRSVEKRPGLGDDLIVPLGLMAALRSEQPFHTVGCRL